MNKFRMNFFKGIVGAIAFAGVVFSMMAVEGRWTGKLEIQGVSLPLVLNLQDSDGGTLDSPLQNAYGLPVKVDHASADSLAWSCPSIGAAYQGKISDKEINGVFMQGGFKFPLTFIPEESLILRRPQTPQPPFPYQTIDTVFHAIDGTKLAGTVTIPADCERKSFPMVVMVTGSGAQNRDEELFDHKPFAVITDYLARNGIASLRYDDRGFAQSGGSFQQALPETFKDDAQAAIAFARGFNNGGKAGILGHSEGGTFALMLAEEGIPDFIITLAGMSVSAKETILDQNRHSLENNGLTPVQIQSSMNLISGVLDEIIARTKDNRRVPVDIDALASEIGGDVPPMVLQSLKNNTANNSPYFGKLLMLDARGGMNKIKCPVLAVNGSLDTQVNAGKNLSAIRDGIPHAKTYELAGLNHMLQHARTGEINEYAEIKETISPEVLQLISNFIHENNCDR